MSSLLRISIHIGIITLVTGTEYLVAFPKSIGKVQLTGTAGDKGGSFTIGFHNPNKNFTYNLRSFSHRYLSSPMQTQSLKIENRTISIYTDHDISFYGYYQYGAFSPLPVSYLGKSYILPFCGQSSVVVIANHGVSSDVQITFRLQTAVTYAGKTYVDGDVLAIRLGPYQTYTMSFSFSVLGTTIKTTEDAAVFMGTTYNSYVTSFDQLSPVKSHGRAYIVPVDNSTSGYQLQVLSTYPDNSIIFVNGSSIQKPFYHQKIQNEVVVFNTSHPAMVVLCRKARYNSGFTVIPPTSSYKAPFSRIILYPLVGITYALKIITQDRRGLNLQQYSDQNVAISWETVSGYQVGSCSIPAQFATSITSTAELTVLAFHQKFIHSGGFDFLTVPGPILPTGSPDSSQNGSAGKGKEYLIALPSSVGDVFITGAAGMKPGSFQIQLPNINKTYTFDLGPLSRHKFTVPATARTEKGTEHKAFIINTSHEEISIYAHYGYAAFSPLLTSSLGTNYVLPSCSSSSVLALSTIHNNTVIHITFRLKKPMTYESKTYYDGDILTLSLHQYDVFTFPFQFDITGTTLKTSEPVAVFMGNSYNGYIISYDQMLPISVHGREYVVAVDNSTAHFQLQITSAYSDNKIVFNNGTMLARQFYHGQLEANSSLFFTTTRPAMTTLCKVSSYQSALMTIPPVSAYRNRAVSIFPPSGVTYTVKLLASKSKDVKAIRYFDPKMPINWTSIANASYAVGTCTIPVRFSTTFTSEGNFSVLAFSNNYVNNGGYQIDDNTGTGGIIPTQSPPQNESSFKPGIIPTVSPSLSEGQEYLIALPVSVGGVYITGAAGIKPGYFQVLFPNRNNNHTFHLGPFSRHKFTLPTAVLTGTGNALAFKAIVISTSHEEISIYAHHDYAASSPLPVSALGTKYILPFCGQSSLLVLVGTQTTAVQITLRLTKSITFRGTVYHDGDHFSVYLPKYQVFRMDYRYDVTGTIVESTKPIAVFIGTSYNGYITSYDQLPPADSLGTEFIAAVDNSSSKHSLRTVSEYIDTELTFNNGSTVRSQYLELMLPANDMFSFNSSRPILTVLCRVVNYYSGFTIVPDVTSYSTKNVNLYPPSGINYVMKILTVASAFVNVRRYFNPTVSIDWQTVLNTEFKVGTCYIPAQYSSSISSDKGFTVFAYTSRYFHGGPYRNVSTDQPPIVSASTSVSYVTYSVTNTAVTYNASIKTSDHPNSNTVTDNPVNNTVVTNKPLTHNPVTHNPETNTSVTPYPETNASVTHNPVTNNAVTNRPVTPHPETNTSETYYTETNNPVTNNPVTYTPVTNNPVTYNPVTNTSVTPYTETNTSVTHNPVTNKAVTNKPVTPHPEKNTSVKPTPVTHNPMTHNPVTYNPMTQNTETKYPVTTNPVTNSPDDNSQLSSTIMTTTCNNKDSKDGGAVDNTIPMIVGLVIGVIIIILLLVIIQRLYRRKRANSSIPFRMSSEFDLGRSKETLL